jgi:hypothetical protein
MTTGTTGHERSNLASLQARLDEPQVAAALSNVLDHADLLAVLLVGLDGFVSRSETIGDALTAGIGEIRELTASLPRPEGISGNDVVASLMTLSGVLPQLTRLLTHVVDSGVVDPLLNSGVLAPHTVERMAVVARALIRADAGTEATEPMSVRGLLRLRKDPQIARALAYGVSFLRSLGAELQAADRPATPTAIATTTEAGAA